jgi:hypothetical protein
VAAWSLPDRSRMEEGSCPVLSSPPLAALLCCRLWRQRGGGSRHAPAELACPAAAVERL